jgi:hypothetical protein
MSHPVRLVAAAIGAVTAVALLGACTGSSSGASQAVGTAGGGAVAAPAHRAAAAAGTVPSPARDTASGGSPGSTDARLAAADIGGAKIRIASMTVQVARGVPVAAQADRAEAIALGAGGEVDSDDRTSGRNAVATLVVRVPPEQLGATLTQLSKLGTEKGRRLSTQDVTSKVADVNSRVASARAAIARLRVLYQRARKIADVINLESELSTRESDLESLQAQQRALAAETSTAAITLTLTSPPRKTHHVGAPESKHHDTGFLGGLRGGWHAFTTGLGVLATAIGAMLPFLILLAALALALRLLWPRLQPRLRPARAPAPHPDPH